MKELMLPANVHYTKDGSRVLGKDVAQRTAKHRLVLLAQPHGGAAPLVAVVRTESQRSAQERRRRRRDAGLGQRRRRIAGKHPAHSCTKSLHVGEGGAGRE